MRSPRAAARWSALSFGLALCSLLPPGTTYAHDEGAIVGESLNLRDLLTNFLIAGVTLAPPAQGVDHSAHFSDESDQLAAFLAMNREIGRQISTVPLASSAGGFAYRLDPATGLFVRPTRSFGPVFVERPLSVGKGKINIGWNFSQFTFDRIDDVDLREGEVSLVFRHQDLDGDDIFTPYWEGDVVTSRMFLSIDANIQTLVATYGIEEGLDLGIAVPWIDLDLQASATSRVDRLSTGSDSGVHEFPNGTRQQTVFRSGSASGLGDVMLRGKYRLVEGRLALGGQLRLPTGDEKNLLGTGHLQGKVSIFSALDRDPLSPHLSLGAAFSEAAEESEFTVDLGVDWVADDRLTLSADILGRILPEAGRVHVEDQTIRYNTADSGPPVIEEAAYERLAFDEADGLQSWTLSTGFKLNVRGNLLLTLNGLVPLNEGGLRDEFSSLLGLDLSF